jgi:hypothetical protein
MNGAGCDRNAAITSLRHSERTMFSRVKKAFIELTNDELDLIEKYILDIPVIGVYDEKDTPLDNFDSKCHNCKDGY